jgi:hypothetical protein
LLEEARVKAYLSQFRTIEKDPIDSVLIIRQAGARAIVRDDLAFLRNCFAVAVVLLARANRCRRHFGTGPTFSDAFDFPPVWLRRGPGLLVETPSVFSGGGTDETFCGHPSPAYPYGKSEAAEWDKPLLDALLSVWRAPKRGVRAGFRRRIARILEIVYTAMRAPAHNLSSGNDWGIALALWVSAFETATNVAGSVSFANVRNSIEAVPWPQRLRRRLAPYEWRSPGRRTTVLPRMIRPVQIYGRLYRARNMVLHGEDYERGRLEPGRRHRTWGPLHLEAGVVFRCALLNLLATHGHGAYLRQPTAAEARGMTLEDGIARWVAVQRAHDNYVAALGRGQRGR